MEAAADVRTSHARRSGQSLEDGFSGAEVETTRPKILHVLVDDKFIDMAIREFEAVAPGIHSYIIIDSFPPFRYIKCDAVRSCPRSMFSREVAREEITGIVFHWLASSHYDLLDLIPESKMVFWIGWGGDYYDTLLRNLHPKGFYLPATAELCRPTAKELSVIVARDGWRWVRRVFWGVRQHDISCLKRVDYFSPVIDLEFELVRQFNPWFRADYVAWNYGTVEDDLSLPDSPSETLGANLLVGNSATPTNIMLRHSRLSRTSLILRIER